MIGGGARVRLSRQAQRVLGVALAFALAAGGHLALLGALDPALPASRTRGAAPMQVRTLVPPRVEPPAAPPVQATAPPPPRAALPPLQRPNKPRARPVPVVAEPPAAQAVATAAPETPAAEPAAAVVVEADIQTVADTAAVPTYRTRPPPPATLRYELTRGLLRGSGDLRWQPRADAYSLRLEGRVAGVDVLVQVSQGGFDAAGLAPQRFTDQRVRRSAQAANFRRDAGKVTFSGPAVEFPLLPGMQDRLSWMIQLAAVLAAEPSRAAPGGRVVLPVVGARGDLSVWVFAYAGPQAVSTPDGSIAAEHFVREARGVRDTHVEVWLDPARHHLPVRATQRNGDDGETFELRLRTLELP